MSKFKFVHDEVQDRKYLTVETVLELDESLDFFQLITALKKTKERNNIDVIEVYKEIYPNRWFKLSINYQPQKIKELMNV